MSENEKKELNECELGKIAGGVYVTDCCSDYQPKPSFVNTDEAYHRCSNCVHFNFGGRNHRDGSCDLGH